MKMRWFFAGFGVLFAIAVGAVSVTGGYPVRILAQFLNVNSAGLNPSEGGSIFATPPVVGQAAIYSNGDVVSTGNVLSHANQNINGTEIYLHGGQAEFVTINGSAGVNQKLWSFFADGAGVYHWRQQPDNFGAAIDFFACAHLDTTNTGMKCSLYPTGPTTGGNITWAPSSSTPVFEESIFGGNTSGASNGLVVTAGTTSADMALSVVNAGNTTAIFQARGDGVVLEHSVIQPRVAYGQIVQGTSTCSIGGGAQSSGLTSCAFSATGVSNVNITAEGFASAPSCTATIQGNIGASYNVSVSGITSTNVTVNAALAGVATNETLFVTCYGT